jgi:uncharacterized protein (TIGR02265 family)
MSEPGSVKASSHLTTVMYIERLHGDEGVERIYGAISIEEADLLRKLRAKDWCPLPAYTNYMLAADEIYGQGDLALCRELGHASARWQIPGLVRAAMRMFSPLQMVNHFQSGWSRMMDRGRAEATQTGDTSLVLRIHEFDPFHRAVCERLCGFFAATVEMTGGRNPSVAHPRCVATGNLVCEFAVSWLQRRPTLGSKDS